ncbi:capsular exopolysaccharide family [Rhodospirillales bacterium URHD0017]|nr:capsular exopolysaccharide family [Rhodospirillales bacterium URHD0017]
MKSLSADFSPVALLDNGAAKWHERRLKSTFSAMRRRWWFIAAIGCFGLAGAAAWLAVTKPQYTATALVQLDTRNKFVSFESNAGSSSREAESSLIRTEVEVLRSNTVVERVVKELDLANDAEFNPSAATALTQFADGLLADLRKHLSLLGIPSGSSQASTAGGKAVESVEQEDGRSNSPQFGGFNQNQSRSTVVTDNNGVILGSIVDKGAETNGRDAGSQTTADGRSPDRSTASTEQKRLIEDKLALTIRRVRKNLSVDADGRSYIIMIGFAATTPQKSALIANAFAKQYLATQIDAKMALTGSANEWAKKQLDSAGVQLREAEEAIEQFRAQHEGKIEVGPGNTVAVSRQLGQLLAQLNEKLAAATQARIAAETRLTATKDLVKRNEVFVIPEVLASPLLHKLREEEARVAARRANLETRLGPQFPDVQAATGELARIQSSIKSNVSQIIASIEAEAQVTRVQEQELAGKIESMRKSVGETSQQQLQLSVLERRAEARRTFHAAIEKRYVETLALLHGVYPDARIVARAAPPPLPSSPNIPLVLTAGAVLGALVGAAIAVLLELADRSFRTPSQLEEATGRACVGILPDLGHAFHRRTVGDLPARSSRVFRESVRTICVALDAATSVNDRKGHVVLVTSALPQEGKTLSSVALAASLAASGSKTLVIDADLRRPQMGGYLAAMARSEDLASMLADSAAFPSATAIDENLYAIRGGDADESAQRLFLSEQFGAFMEAAKTQFDVIVVDSPPAMVVADAAILARFADAVVHVVRWGRTRRSTVLDSMDRMRRANAGAIGVTLLNRVNPEAYFKYHRDGGWSFKYARHYKPVIGPAGTEHKRP